MEDSIPCFTAVCLAAFYAPEPNTKVAQFTNIHERWCPEGLELDAIWMWWESCDELDAMDHFLESTNIEVVGAQMRMLAVRI